MANFVYIATSVDGFIADRNGDISWLDELPVPEGEDMGYEGFMARIDALLMGRKTYEKVLSFGIEWPYAKKVFVLSSTLTQVDAGLEGRVEIIQGQPEDVTSRLARQGYKNLYIDGGKVIQGFLAANLIDEMIITRVPIVLGSGIPLFDGSSEVSLRLEHRSTEVYGNEYVKSHYVRR